MKIKNEGDPTRRGLLKTEREADRQTNTQTETVNLKKEDFQRFKNIFCSYLKLELILVSYRVTAFRFMRIKVKLKN